MSDIDRPHLGSVYRAASIPRPPRPRRDAHPWPVQGQWWIVLALGASVIVSALFMFVTRLQSQHYTHVKYVAVLAEILVVGLIVAAGVLYRLGFPLRPVCATGLGALVATLAFALLPGFLDDSPWLTGLLGTVVSLVYNIFVALGVGVLTRYVPWPSDSADSEEEPSDLEDADRHRP